MITGGALLFLLGQLAPEFPSCIGEQACLECHAPLKSARACTLEPIPTHHSAFESLAREEAPHIALLTGTVEAPTQSLLCLGCHATSTDLGPRWTQPSFDIRLGVQCEACHGPGSDHVRARRAGLANEVPPPLGIRRGERESCDDCHRPRPSHERVLKQGFRAAAADKLYKTPVNLALAPDGRRIYVACEHSDSLVVLDAQSGALVREIPVGRRPHDVAPSPDGTRLYVTNRFSGSLSVIDAHTLEVLREVAVGDDPHGVLVAPDGRRVYVLDTGADAISVLDARTLLETQHLSAGCAPWSLALRPDGKTLVVSSLRPQPAEFRAPHHSELSVVALDEDVVVQRAVLPDADMLQGVAAVPGRDVVLCTLMRTKNLVPITRLSQGWVTTNGLGLLWGDGRTDQVLLDLPNRAFSDVGDVAVSPDGRFAAVSSGGADEIALLDVERLLKTIESASPERRADVLPNQLGLCDEFVLQRLRVGSNPRGLCFAPDGRRLYVALALEDAVAVVDLPGFTLARTLSLGGPAATSPIRAGEKLFHDATCTQGRQLSCRSCHPDGHVNGLSFDIEGDGLGLHPLDNRTLRGIYDTPPFKWEGTNPTLQRQCGPRFAVFFTRLDPFTPAEIESLVSYMCTIERPPNPQRAADGLTPRQRRGKALFERTRSNDGQPIPRTSRCTNCHNSPYKELGTVQTVGTSMWFDALSEFGEPDLHDEGTFGPLGTAYFQDAHRLARKFDTPALIDVYASPPYLHNGAAATLEEIWTRYNLYQGHGVTHDLTRGQLNDLVAYLRCL